MAVDSMRVMGRATQGVRLINLKEDDAIAAVAKVEFIEGDEDDTGELEGEESTVENTDETDTAEIKPADTEE